MTAAPADDDASRRAIEAQVRLSVLACPNCDWGTIFRDGHRRCTGCGLPTAYCPASCGYGSAMEDDPAWDAL
jgi:hypothetical protein